MPAFSLQLVICKWSFFLWQHGELQSICAEVFISTCLRTKFLTSRFRANSFLRKPGYVIRASTNIWWPGFVHHLRDGGAGRSARMDISLVGMSSQFGHSMTGKENYPVHVLTTGIETYEVNSVMISLCGLFSEDSWFTSYPSYPRLFSSCNDCSISCTFRILSVLTYLYSALYKACSWDSLFKNRLLFRH